MATKRNASRRSGEGSISSYTTKAGTKWRYQIRVPNELDNPDGPTKLVGKGGFDDENAASMAMLQALAQRNEGITGNGKPPTLGAYAQRWLDGLSRDRYAGSTLAGYGRIVNLHIVPYPLAARRVDQVRGSDVNEHLQALRASLGLNSVSKVRTQLHAIFDAVVEDGYRATNPVESKTVRKNAPTPARIAADAPEVITWDARTLAAFLTWNKQEGDYLHPLWRLIAYTGMRRSEALALRWSDINFRAGTVNVRRAVDTSRRDAVKAVKNERTRKVPTDAGTMAELKQLKVTRGSINLALVTADSYVFGLAEGRLRKPADISNAWAVRLRQFTKHNGEGTPQATLHGLRHTHATLLLQGREHPKLVQERLGHSSITVTMGIYSHVTDDMGRETSDLFTGILADAQPLLHETVASNDSEASEGA